MADLTRREKLAKESLYDIGYEYLRTNFRKFNQRNKIKVAISILNIFEKDDSKTDRRTVIVMPMIQKSGEAPNVNMNLEFNIGAAHSSEDPGYSLEASRLN